MDLTRLKVNWWYFWHMKVFWPFVVRSLHYKCAVCGAKILWLRNCKHTYRIGIVSKEE